MKLDLEEIAKEVFKDKELFIEELQENRVKIWYKAHNVTNLKPVVLPKFIELNKEFAEGIGLYVADGKTTPNDKRHIEFSSIDEDISLFMLNFFILRLNTSLENIYIRIRYSNGNEDEIIDKWSTALHIPTKKIVIRKYAKNKTDCFNLHINSKILRIVFERIIYISLNEIPKDFRLSQAFLRGHFAADGGLETRRNKNFVQIQKVIFAYHKTREIWLRKYIITLLKSNGINSIEIKEYKDKETACIRINFWRNFHNIFEIKLFERSLRKKNIVMKCVRTSSIYLKLKPDFHRKLFNDLKMSQKEIAKIINCLSYGQICDTVHGKHLLKLEQINNIIRKLNLSWQEVINNSIQVRIGQCSYVNLNNKSVNFILNEKMLTNLENPYF